MRANRPDTFDPTEAINDQPMLQAVIDGYGFDHTLVATLTEDGYRVRGEAGIPVGARVLEALAPEIRDGEMLVVTDARTDDRFAHTAMVTTEPAIVSALAAPFYSPTGEPVGAVVVAGTQPRSFPAADLGQMHLAVGMLEAQQADMLNARRAHDVQRALMPAGEQAPAGYEVDACSIVRGNITGDYFDWARFSEDRFVFGLAAVHGSGIGAGMLAAASRAAIRTAGAIEGISADVAAIAKRAARALHDDLTAAGVTISALYGILDAPSGTVSFVNAGFEPALVLRAGSRDPQPTGSTGPAVGVDPDPRWALDTVTLHAGDTFVVPSAGARVALAAATEYAHSASGAIDAIEGYARSHPEQAGVAALALHREAGHAHASG